LGEIELNAEPALGTDKGNKPIAGADELVAEPGKAAVNTSEGNTHFENTEIVAKNEVSVSPDAVVAGALTVPEAKLEEQETPAEDQASDTLTEESQLSDAMSHYVAKMSVRGAMAKKITARAGLNKNGSKVVSKAVSKVASKTASKIVSGNTRLKLAKATISGKQMGSKKSYAVKSSKVRLGMAAVSKAKAKASAGLGSVKFASAKSRKVKANQIKASLG
jgi:hypothetical protein